MNDQQWDRDWAEKVAYEIGEAIAEAGHVNLCAWVSHYTYWPLTVEILGDEAWGHAANGLIDRRSASE